MKQGKSWLTAFLPAVSCKPDCLQLDRIVVLSSPQYSVLSFVLCFCSPMSLKLLFSWVLSLLIGALGSRACLFFVFVIHPLLRVCIVCTVCAAERDYKAKVVPRNLFGAIDSCVLFSWVLVVFSTSVSSVYCLLSVREERDSCTQ